MYSRQQLRSYPTESTEFIEYKADNKMYANVLATTKQSKESALLSKLVTLREQISTIGSPRTTVKTARGMSEHVGVISPRSFGKRLDEKLPMKELGEIANYFNTLRAEQAKTLSKNYVNEMVQKNYICSLREIRNTNRKRNQKYSGFLKRQEKTYKNQKGQLWN